MASSLTASVYAPAETTSTGYPRQGLQHCSINSKPSDLSVSQGAYLERFILSYTPSATSVVTRMQTLWDMHVEKLSTVDLISLIAIVRKYAPETRSKMSAQVLVRMHDRNQWELITCILLKNSQILPAGHPENPNPYMVLKVAENVLLSDGQRDTTSALSYLPVRIAWAIQKGFFTEALYLHFVGIASVFASLGHSRSLLN